MWTLRALLGLGVLVVAGCSSSDSPAGDGQNGDAGAGTTGNTGNTGNTGATGTPLVLGPDLATIEASNTFACGDGYPIQTNPTFPQPFYMQGQPSCTVLSYVASAQKAPETGTALSATIKVGAKTGPMRFVRMRILFQNGGNPQCCSIEQVSETFTPQANGTTTVNLGFPMAADHVPPATDTTTIIRGDSVALEVLAPDVPIPGFWQANGGPVTGIANYIYFPAISTTGTPVPSPTLLNHSGSYSGFVPSFTIAYREGA